MLISNTNSKAYVGAVTQSFLMLLLHAVLIGRCCAHYEDCMDALQPALQRYETQSHEVQCRQITSQL